MLIAFERNEIETCGFHHSKEVIEGCKARQIIHTYTLLLETANVHQMRYGIYQDIIEYILENRRNVKTQKTQARKKVRENVCAKYLRERKKRYISLTYRSKERKRTNKHSGKMPLPLSYDMTSYMSEHCLTKSIRETAIFA